MKFLWAWKKKDYGIDYINLSFGLFDIAIERGLGSDLGKVFIELMFLKEIDDGRLHYYNLKNPEIGMFVEKGDWEWVEK